MLEDLVTGLLANETEKFAMESWVSGGFFLFKVGE